MRRIQRACGTPKLANMGVQPEGHSQAEHCHQRCCWAKVVAHDSCTRAGGDPEHCDYRRDCVSDLRGTLSQFVRQLPNVENQNCTN
jgi:hypothetical protein